MPLTFHFNYIKGKFNFIKRIFFILICQSTFAQINVTMPVERSVFQRVNNVASIHIGGNILYAADEVQARVLPIQGGLATDWKVVDQKPIGGTFVGELTNVTGGWYKLEVRALANGMQLGEIVTVAKVGVGEVLFIAGQSNAQGGRPPMGGFYDFTKYAATDDRVNCIDYFDADEYSILPFPKIIQLKAETDIAPHGHASWCYGLLGDKIAKELNVPVLFFNAAEGGTRISQWAQGARGEPTYNFYTNRIAKKGWPFIILEKSLHYYASLFGIRAVLWHQGEEDSAINTNPNNYAADLETVITKSREKTGKNLSWMVAKVSFTKFGTKETIKNAQQSIIDKSDFNVLQGPDTDLIQPSINLRDDNVHFRNTGLIELADAWAKYIINENFISRTKPFLANPLVKSSLVSCSNGSVLTIALPNNFDNPTWFLQSGNIWQESSLKSISVNEETYGFVKDSFKNILSSPPIKFTPLNIEIKTEKLPVICEGEQYKLFVESPNIDFLWSTGEKTKSILVSKAGDNYYFVGSQDAYGCIARTETTFNLKVLTLPPAPTIEALSATTLCEGEKVSLKEKNTSQFGKIWNTSQKTSSIEVNKNGNYFLQNIDQNGCKSASSNNIEVKVNPLPVKPVINVEGKAQFCTGDSLKLIANLATKYVWKNESGEITTNTNQLYIKSGGNYSLNTLNEYNCKSISSDQIQINQLSLPNAPIIEAIGKTIICAGDSVQLLTKNSGKSYNWVSDGNNIEASVNQKLKIITNSSQNSSEKTYKLNISDENDCISPFSNEVKVILKAKPIKPLVEKVGPYTILASSQKSTTNIIDFKWYLNENAIETNESMLKITKSGIYNVIQREKYIIDNTNLVCASDKSNEIKLDISNEELILYPNPVTDGDLYIETFSNEKSLGLKIITLSGQEVFSITGIDTSSRNKVNLGNISGYFIAEISLGGKLIRKAILVNN
jgi:Carbohydrate esterase, sialic acid-specific acetylesterase